MPDENRSSNFPSRRDWIGLAAALLLLLTFCLGGRGLNEPDEGRYGSIALTMASPGGDWWEPRMSGWGHYDKPPLIYWATALSFRLFGVNEWAARLPSFAGAVLALTGLAWAAWRLRGASVAWWAVLVCGTCTQFWLLGRVLTPDMLLCGWCTLAIAAWAECRQRGGAWGFWLLSLLCWVLAWWTKATPALIPLAGLAAGVFAARDQAGQKALRLPLLLALILVLGSPWYVSMLWHHPDLRSFFFVRELASRVAGSDIGRHHFILFYLPVCLVAWLPWWPVAVWCWRHDRNPPGESDWRAVARRAVTHLSFESWIVIVGVAILTLVSSKLATYTVTLLPWAALAMARVMAARAGRPDGRLRVRFLLPAAGFALFALVGALFAPRYEARIGVNSSVRRLCRFLANHKARRVDFDHYWPSAEIYLPDAAIYYAVPDEAVTARKEAAKGIDRPFELRFHERPSDHGKPPNHFNEIGSWPALSVDDPQAATLNDGELWFVRFVKQKDSPFNDCIKGAANDKSAELMLRDGDFRVYRAVLTHGHFSGLAGRSLPRP